MRTLWSDNYAVAACGLVVFAVCAIAQPLAAYTVALAAFGLPHVLSELRYVDRRFGRTIDRGQLATIAVILAGVVGIRVATVTHLLPAAIGIPAELSGVAGLALACLRGPRARVGLALSIALILGLCALLAPFGTAAILSILHNLTPLGFLWQLTPRSSRPRVMSWATGALVGLPLLVASGLPRLALGLALGRMGEADPLSAGPIADHLFVYVPPALLQSAHAIDLFTASVVAQGAHYLAVILILPSMLRRFDPQANGLVGWPRGSRFGLCVAVIGGASLALFLQGFALARSFYGVAAALHAWIEVPILILALTGGAQEPIRSPASSEAELARNEIGIA